MKHIYTYGSQPAKRNLTVECLFKNKAIGKRMTQVTAIDPEEAVAAANQQIDLLVIETNLTESIRAAAPHIFITAHQTMRQYVTEDEALGGAIDTMVKGADAISTPRGLKTIERIAREGISVQGHTGLFPSRAMEEKKPKNQPKVRQLEVPQKKGDKLEDLKIYYTNLSPNDYEVKVENKKIIILPT